MSPGAMNWSLSAISVADTLIKYPVMMPFCDSIEGGDQDICNTLGLRGVSDIPNGEATGTVGTNIINCNENI